MSFYLLAVLSSIVDLFVQAILETMLSSQDTKTEQCLIGLVKERDGNALGNIRKAGNSLV